MTTEYWAEHPDYPAADWQREVAEGDTRLGYHAWCAVQVDKVPPPEIPGRPLSDRHLHYVDTVLKLGLHNGVPLAPVTDDDGNATDRLLLCLPHWEPRVEVVVPEPPEDWSPTAPTAAERTA
jgi:hypothetical protein